MKNLSILVLLLSVIIWGCDKSSSTTSTSKQASGRIVYVNTDTLLNQYDYYKDVAKASENKRFRLETDISNKAKNLQNKAAFFQQKAQQGGLTQEQGQTAQAQLQQEEQSIMAFRDKAAQDLAKEDAKKSEEVLSNIQAFLKSYNAGDKYDMVIGYSKGGNVFYAKEDLDITKAVLEGLNKKYADDKKSGKVVVADSTVKK